MSKLRARKVHTRSETVFCAHIKDAGLTFVLPTDRDSWPDKVYVGSTGLRQTVEIFTSKSVLSFAGKAYALPKVAA